MQLDFIPKSKKQVLMRQMTIKPKKKQYWTREEDEKLQQLVQKFEVSYLFTLGKELEKDSFLLFRPYRCSMFAQMVESSESRTR